MKRQTAVRELELKLDEILKNVLFDEKIKQKIAEVIKEAKHKEFNQMVHSCLVSRKGSIIEFYEAWGTAEDFVEKTFTNDK